MFYPFTLFRLVTFCLPVSTFGIYVFSALLLTGCFSAEDRSTASCDDVSVPEGMQCIPGGVFQRGSERISIDEDSRSEIADERPVMEIEISPFFMDTFEVTYGQYQTCVQDGDCTAAGPNYRGYSAAAQPMLGLTWFQARQYCEVNGKRLPTEAEWEFAARGPESEIYPWGNDPIGCEKAIIQENESKGCGRGSTWPVGSRPAYRYGLHDMAGNSWEWVADWYSEDYEACGPGCTGKDPLGPCEGADDCSGYDRRVLKGGSWWWDGEYAISSNRRAHYPDNSPFHHYGFRCSRSLSLTGIKLP